MRRKLLSLSLFASLSACSSITLPDTTICTAAGKLSNGMDCAHTISDEVGSMTLDESIVFLEPTDTRGGAVCMSSQDFAKLKTAIEQACARLKSCQHEKVEKTLMRLDELQAKAKAKRPKK